MILVNCEINLTIKYVICEGDRETTFAITDTKLCVSVVTLQSQDSIGILKSSFKQIIYWNKYWSTPKTLLQNRDLNYLIDSSFRRVNRLFVPSFEDDNGRIDYFIDENVMTGGRNVFDQLARNNIITYENIKNVAIGQENNYTTGCLLDYPNFKKKTMS